MAKRRAETIHFETRALEKIRTPASRVTLYDSLREGLGIVIHPSGSKIFFWLRRVGPERKHKWIKLGKFPTLSVASARAEAEKLNAAAEEWHASGFTGKPPRLTSQSDMTLGELNEEYCDKYLRHRSKNPDRRMKETRQTFAKYLGAWKDRKIRHITKNDVRELHAAIGEKTGHFAANRVVQNLRAAFNWATEAELYDGENPAVIRRLLFFEPPRERFLQPDEVKPLFRALRDEPNIDARDFILLALLTGKREGNVLEMRWDRIDFASKTWTIPDPKNRTPVTTALTPEALAILARRRKAATNKSPDWVFPSSTSKSGHVADFKHQWYRVRKRAKLKNFRFHDLRHTPGSWLAALNYSDLIVGKVLGHKSQASARRYSHLNLGPVRTALQQATNALFAAGKVDRKLLTSGKAPRQAKRLPAAARHEISAARSGD